MRTILLIVALFFGYIATSFSVTQVYFECDGCTTSEMKIKATSKSILTHQAEAHVFNETDRIYKKYFIWKEVVTNEWLVEAGTTFTKVSSVSRTPDANIKHAFEEYIDAKRLIIAKLKVISFSIDGSGVVRTEIQPSRDSSSRATLSTSGAETPLCTAKETGSGDVTAVDYISDHRHKSLLFQSITSEFDSSGVGNMPEFFAKHDKLFTIMAETGIPIKSQVGATLSIIGRDSNSIKILTADGGRMFVSLNFGRKTATIEEAFDGDCNQIPLTEGESITGEFTFSTVSGSAKMERLLKSYGVSIFAGSNFLSCSVSTIRCSTTQDGRKTCASKCIKWKAY